MTDQTDRTRSLLFGVECVALTAAVLTLWSMGWGALAVYVLFTACVFALFRWMP